MALITDGAQLKSPKPSFGTKVGRVEQRPLRLMFNLLDKLVAEIVTTNKTSDRQWSIPLLSDRRG